MQPTVRSGTRLLLGLLQLSLGMALMNCHPEGLLLAEGSPAMFQPKMLFPGSHPNTPRHAPRACRVQFQLEAFREILRANEALQDDKAGKIGSLRLSRVHPKKSRAIVARDLKLRHRTL